MSAPLMNRTLPPPSETRLFEVWPFFFGAGVLAIVWQGPMPERLVASFFAHMTMQMAVIGLAAPLLAFGLLRLLPELRERIPADLPILAAVSELVFVWGWHLPQLHDVARLSALALVLEQGSLFLAGLGLWIGVLSLGASGSRKRRWIAAGCLIFTAAHLGVLGVYLLIQPDPLYACSELCVRMDAPSGLEEQRLGALAMILVGGLAHLTGALAILGRMVPAIMSGEGGKA
ncbi:cytochrome c oxidase assembly protein [Fulvimarina manganoxydans]|nr:cytochrome c oxidase assembly protein [Fulvimarina manganoxydans]